MNRGFVWISGRPKYGWSETRDEIHTIYEHPTPLHWARMRTRECYEVKYYEADIMLRGGTMHFVSRYWLLRKKPVAGYRPIGAVL